MNEPTIPPPTINQPRLVLTPEDLVEQLRPPTIWAAEWAIAKIEKTLRKRKEPGWSDDDVACLGTAVRLCADPAETIPFGLQKRFKRSCGKLATPVARHQNDVGWIDFGKKVRAITPIVDAACLAQTAINLIAAILAPNGVEVFAIEEAPVIEEARKGVVKFRDAMPKRLVRDFYASLSGLEVEAREGYDKPHWIALAGALHMLIPSVEWVQEAEAAITIMATLTNSEADADSPGERERKIQHLRGVFRRFGSIHYHGHDSLPHIVAIRLKGAAYAFAEAVIERPCAQSRNLKHALRIKKAADGFGYECWGQQVLLPFEYLP